MSSKYVIVIPCSANYIPGLNATLNGLDKYGNTADVKVIEEGIPEDYKEKARTVFNFDVEFIPIADLLKGEYHLNMKNSSFGRWVFSPYILYMRIKDKYKVAALVGADMVIINNIMHWFEVAEKTGLIVTCDNPYTMSSFQDLDERHVRLNGLVDTEPVSDAPGFMDLSLHEDIIKKTIENSNLTDENMRAYNSAILNLKRFDRLLVLDSMLWTCGIFYLFKVERSMGVNNRMGYFANRERMNSIHKKYWLDSIIYQALYDKVPGTWLYDNTMNNMKIFCNIYRDLNTKHKLIYEYPPNEIFAKLKSGEIQLKCQKLNTC